MSGPTLSDQPHMPMLKAAVDAAQPYVAQLRDHLDEVRAELDAAEAKLARQEPVIEAAKAWREAWRGPQVYDKHSDYVRDRALASAVDALEPIGDADGA